MTYMKYLYIYLFGVFTCLLETITTENKTSSECWGCNPTTPHVLSCTGSGVIVIRDAHYGYNGDCRGGKTRSECSGTERNRCCKPGGQAKHCFKSFNKTDREELERTCSSKSNCTFNSIKHDQLYTCGGSTFINSFTQINYTCQIPGSSTVSKVPITSSTKTPIDTTTQYDTTSSRIPAYKENKTSSECWECNPNTPHVLYCTGSSVIVIHSASYGYKGSCVSGISSRGACTATERDRCCSPMLLGGFVCYKRFNIRDKEELERTCSSKPTCSVNSIKHNQPYNCAGFTFSMNTFTLINYTCQIPGTLPSDGGNEIPSSDGKITSGEIGGIVVGVIAIVILLCIAGFILYQRYENTKSTKNRQPESNRQQSTTRTVGVQYRETDFTDITTSPNITTSSSDTTYSQLNRLGSQPVQYDDLIMNNNNRNSTTDNNYNNYYNQQYMNM